MPAVSEHATFHGHATGFHEGRGKASDRLAELAADR